MRRQQRPFLLCQDQVPAVAAVACDARNLAARGRGGDERRGQVSRWGHVCMSLCCLGELLSGRAQSQVVSYSGRAWRGRMRFW